MSRKGSYGLALAAALVLLPLSASALPIEFTNRGTAFETYARAGTANSYDRNPVDFFSIFAPVSGPMGMVGAFTVAGGTTLDSDLILEITLFSNSDSLGVYNQSGVWTELVSGAASTTAVIPAASLGDGTYTFALQAPTLAGGNQTYHANDTRNADYQAGVMGAGAHIVGFFVNQDVSLNINGRVESFLEGDLILAMEDLFGYRFHGTDADFNDMVVRVRGFNNAPIPEPASVLLLVSGLAGFGLRRKMKA